jgi:tetratricopeptide (TPR) repeat protein
VLADSLAKLLAGHGVTLERTTCEKGAPTTRVLVPDLIVLAGDAAQDRGKVMLAQLASAAADATIATLVIAPPDLGGFAFQPTPSHVAFLGLEGGTSECARRILVLAELYLEEGLATCSLQQLADTVAPQVKPPATPARAPASAGSAAKVASAVATQKLATTPATQQRPRAQTGATSVVSSNAFAEKVTAALAIQQTKRVTPASGVATQTASGATAANANGSAAIAVGIAEAVRVEPAPATTTSESSVQLAAAKAEVANVAPARAANEDPSDASQVVATHPPAAKPSAAKGVSSAQRAQPQVQPPRSPRATFSGTKAELLAGAGAAPAAKSVAADSSQAATTAQPAAKPTAAEPNSSASSESKNVARASTLSEGKRVPNAASATTKLAVSPPSTAVAAASPRPATPTIETGPREQPPRSPRATFSGTKAELLAADTAPAATSVAASPSQTATAAQSAAKPPAAESTLSTPGDANNLSSAPAASPKLSRATKQTLMGAAGSARAAIADASPPAKIEKLPGRSLPRATFSGIKPESLPAVAAPKPATPASAALRETAPPTATVAASQPASGAAPAFDVLASLPVVSPEPTATAAEPSQPVASVAPAEQIIFSLSDRAPDSSSLRNAVESVPKTEFEISVSMSEPAPRPASLHKELASPTAEPMTSSRKVPPRLRKRDTLSRAAEVAPVRAAEVAPVRAAEVAPAATAQRREPPLLLNSKRALATDASPLAANDTLMIQRSAPAPAPEVIAQPSRAPKLRRAANPFAEPQVSPAQQAPQSQWLPAPGFAQSKLPAQPQAPQGALAALLAAQAAADAQPSAARPSSAAAHAFVYIAVIACCAALAFMWYDRHAREIDAAAALASLHAGMSSSSRSSSNRTATKPTPTTRTGRTSTATRPVAAANRSISEAAVGFDTSDSTRDASSARDIANRAELLVDEGALLFEDGRLGLAEASYLQALKSIPGYPRAMAGLVRVHIARKDGAEAVRWAKQLVAKQPKNGQHQLLLGDAEALHGDSAAARDAWKRAIRYGSAAAMQRPLTSQ